MSSNEEVVFCVLQFLKEMEYNQSMHKLEEESGIFFNMNYLEDLVTNGEWESVENYLRAFTKFDENEQSREMLLEILKVKYLEAVAEGDEVRAAQILGKELRESLYLHGNLNIESEVAQILKKRHTNIDRSTMFDVLTKLIVENPLFISKLHIPTIDKSKVRQVIQQSLGQINRKVGCRLGLKEVLGFADDLPDRIVACVNLESPVTSMDFHPSRTLLLVGTTTGAFSIWEVGDGNTKGKRMAGKSFSLLSFKSDAVSSDFLDSFVKDITASVKRIKWSPNGCIFGVAFSRFMVQVFGYYGNRDLRKHLEFEAHIGSVNDLAFTYVDKELRIITCGGDKTIKVWDAITGKRYYTFQGHEAPVYSICPHPREDVQFILSTSTDGKIKAWQYDTTSSKFNFNAPGDTSTTMVYSADGTRLFSCGTSKDGEAYMVEWKESEWVWKKAYVGLGKCLQGVPQFDTVNNRYLAAGDDFKIKTWKMDNANVLMTINADGGLPAFPCFCFSKTGALLAVSTTTNYIKVLANSEGIKLTASVEKSEIATSEATVIGTFTDDREAAAGTSTVSH